MTHFRAVLFDLDGTLLDTLEDLADATNEMLRANGFPTHPVDAYRYFVGDGARNLVLRALPADRRDDATVSACLARYQQIYATNWDAKTKPYPGVPELLDALSARVGLKLTILSNKPDRFTQLCVNRLLPKWKFDLVLGATAKFPHKPDPAAAIDIARQMLVPVEQFLYVGDTGTDMQTAVAAGMRPVGVLWGFRPERELSEAGARTVIQAPMELLDLLKQEENEPPINTDEHR